MRRHEFAVEDWEEIEQFLQEMTYGFSCTVGQDGLSRVTPLNYVFQYPYFYFHGSLAGEKMKHLKHNRKVSFTVAKEYAMIPSYFTDPFMACPATLFFKSVMVQGEVEIVEDLHEKASAFTLFMEKLQPEGKYEPISADNPEYIPRLKAVSLCRIDAKSITAKFKFGQNTKGDKFDSIVRGLEERNEPIDIKTIALMNKYCPHTHH